jgi:hypothetical protein
MELDTATDVLARLVRRLESRMNGGALLAQQIRARFERIGNPHSKRTIFAERPQIVQFKWRLVDPLPQRAMP